MNFLYRPLKVAEVGENFLVVYDWDQLSENSCPRVWENVQLIDPFGNEIWTVNSMDKSRFWNEKIDVFVGVRNNGAGIQLISFYGNAYDLNLNTGKVTFADFIK